MKNIIEILVCVIIMIALIYALTWMLSLECKVKADKQNLEYDWGLIQGCMIKQNNQWVDYNRLRYIEDQKNDNRLKF